MLVDCVSEHVTCRGPSASFPLVVSQKCKKEMMVCDLHVKLVVGQRLGPQLGLRGSVC